MKYLRTLLITIFLLSSLSSCNQDQADNAPDRTRYNKGLEYLEKGEPKAAIIELMNAVTLEPRFADAHYHLSLAYMENLQGQKAMESMLRATSLAPNNMDAAIRMAGMLLLARQLDDSQEFVMKVLEKDINHPEALTIKASISLFKGDFDEAMHLINKVIKQNPEGAHLYRIRANIYLQQGKVEAGVKDLLHSLELDPSAQQTHWLLSKFYLDTGQFKSAEKQLKEMKKRFPDSFQPYEGLTKLYIQTGRFDQIEPTLKEGIEKTFTATDGYILLSDFYQSNHEFGKAESLLKSGLEHVSRPEDLRASLADLYLSKDLDKLGQAELDEIFAINEKHNRAQLVQAKLLLKQNQPNEAMTIINTLIGNDPKWAEPHYFKTVAHLQRGEHSLARKTLVTTLELDDSHYHAHLLQAKFYLEDNAPYTARQEAQKALVLRPSSAEAGIIIGLSYLNEQNFPKSVKKFEILTKLHPENLEVKRYYGIALQQNKETKKAKKVLKNLLTKNPSYSPALNSLVELALLENNKAEAYSLVQKQIKLDPDLVENYLLLSSLLTGDNEFENALQELETAKQISPQNAYVIHNLAQSHLALGSSEKALFEYRNLVENSPSPLPTFIYSELATLLFQAGNTEKAQELYRKILVLQPSNTDASNNLAWLIANQEKGDLSEAFRLALSARQKQTSNSYYWDTLGWIYFKRGEIDKAIEEITGAITLNPEEPLFYYHLAQIQKSSGEFYKAVALLRKALALNKNFSEKQEAINLLKELE